MVEGFTVEEFYLWFREMVDESNLAPLRIPNKLSFPEYKFKPYRAVQTSSINKINWRFPPPPAPSSQQSGVPLAWVLTECSGHGKSESL